MRAHAVSPPRWSAIACASEPLLYKRGRPLLAVLAGAGLRIQEALDLKWSSVNLARGTLTVEASKTDAGIRVIDLAPALREELVEWRARSRYGGDDGIVFPTHKGEPDNRQNVRRRLLLAAVDKANPKLLEAKVEPIGSVTLHGLRRLFCTLRTVSGEDPVYVADQMGHTDPTFTLKTHAQAVKHRQRLTEPERKAYDEALEWARLGTNDVAEVAAITDAPSLRQEETRRFQRVS